MYVYHCDMSIYVYTYSETYIFSILTRLYIYVYTYFDTYIDTYNVCMYISEYVYVYLLNSDTSTHICLNILRYIHRFTYQATRIRKDGFRSSAWV